MQILCKIEPKQSLKHLFEEKTEDKFPKASKEKLLIDVDGSTIQPYLDAGNYIVVYDDYDVGSVYVQSEIDLGDMFDGRCV